MSLDLPGFADPVADAQRSFRAALDAMAHPGQLHRLGGAPHPPPPLAAATAALLLTLADADTWLWLAPAFAAAREWVAFHTGAPLCADPADAAFVVADTLPDFSRLSAGSDEAPEDSATLIVQVAAIGEGRRFRLSGPGLRTPATLAVAGLPDGFAEIWAGNRALYPRGLDLLLVAGAALVALPRSVTVEAG
jgi:alpha-D-ribose 1-methylphosphonate 5-triphosphate synthase subunit PhnH